MRTQLLLARSVWERVREALRGAERNGKRVLVALDFDGTVVPIVNRPTEVRVPVRTRDSLVEVARLEGVQVAALSARPLRDLARYLPGRGIMRVGQYGLENGSPPGRALRSRIHAGVARLRDLLEPIATRYSGAWIEDKGLTVAVHFRDLAPSRRAALSKALGPVTARARRLGFHTERGRQVLDFVPTRYDKGRALRALRRRVRPAVTFYFGDTAGDEPAFAALGKADFPVRVGPGPTAAPYRVRGPEDVARFLRALVALRRDRSNEEVTR